MEEGKDQITDLNYEKDMKIESDSLDIEWIHHPTKYMKWARLVAVLDKKVKKIKESLDICEAQIDKRMRAAMDKVTEAMLKAEFALDKDHQKLIQGYNQAKYEYNICEAAVKGLEHKKSALENLVRLWAGQYFAGPKEPRDLKEKLNIKEVNQDLERDRSRDRVRERFEAKKAIGKIIEIDEHVPIDSEDE